MPTTQQLESSALSAYSKQPGMIPLPGYVLIEPLGRGGFGEVWKCEVPGGLLKAVKFVVGSDDGLASDDAKLRQELEAFQQVKAIRHPYLLCLERVELVDNELVMVMGLADHHLGDRFHECRQAGLPGIPREELLGYLLEAAEALDVISTQHGLQHLDVKPANLFLTAGHVQVGDYGLVSKLEPGTGTGKTRGLTPKYAAPEVLRGQVHNQSDQYSLALVYQELLTGTFPFSGRSAQQIILQHATAAPDLSQLPERDRGPVATALAKQPGDRYPSCRVFIKALMNAKALSRLGLVTPGQVGSRSNEMPANLIATPAPLSRCTPALKLPQRDDGNDTAQQNQITELSPATSRSPRSAAVDITPQPRLQPATAPPQSTRPNAQSDGAHGIRLEKVFSVLPIEWLRGREAPEPDLTPHEMVRALVAAAHTGVQIPTDPTGVVQLANSIWKCRFLSTIDPRVAKVKLDLLWEQGGLTMDSREERRVIFRRHVPVVKPEKIITLFGKKPLPPPAPEGGLEVVVELPEPGIPVGEVSVLGRSFGSPPPGFVNAKEVVSLLEEVRRQLNNFPDRRKHPRLPAEFPTTIFPLHSDFRVEAPVTGRCENVSAGGLALRVTSQISTKYAFIAFEGVRGTTGLALLLRILRTDREEDGILVTGQYRLDLGQKTSE